MFYTVYKITNLINEKIYIGVHKTDDLNDSYMGSGLLIKHAISKYGIQNFVKEYIAIFNNPEEMFSMESELVNEELIKSGHSYNLKEGGSGGWDYVNSSEKNIYGLNGKTPDAIANLAKGLETQRYLRKNDPEWAARVHENQSIAAVNRNKKYGNGFKGKSHTEQTKAKLRKPRPASAGDKNSQFGTMWITNKILNKKILKTDPIPDGWMKGMTPKQLVTENKFR
jgi:hypothetical protein